MKVYGQVKGRRHCCDQPQPASRKGKRKCPRCECWMPEGDFVGKDGLPKKFCEKCRQVERKGERR